MAVLKGGSLLAELAIKGSIKPSLAPPPDDVITKMTDYSERIVETAAVCKTFSEFFDEWFQSINTDKLYPQSIKAYTLCICKR